MKRVSNYTFEEAIDFARNEMEASARVKQDTIEDLEVLKHLVTLADLCIASLRRGGKVIFAGNGGSFADAQHLSAELVSRLQFDRSPLPSIVLGANSSTFSAIGNDYGFEFVFERELQCLAGENDVFIAITTSGESSNIIAAIKKANELGISVYCFTGDRISTVSALCPCVKVPSSETVRIQECHIVIGHILCALIENSLFRERSLL